MARKDLERMTPAELEADLQQLVEMNRELARYLECGGDNTFAAILRLLLGHVGRMRTELAADRAGEGGGA